MIKVKLFEAIYYTIVLIALVSGCYYANIFIFPFVSKRVISSFVSVQSHIFSSSKATAGITLMQSNGSSLSTPHLVLPHLNHSGLADFEGDVLPEEEKGSPIRRTRVQKQQAKRHSHDPMRNSPNISADPLQTIAEAPAQSRVPGINVEDEDREETVEGFGSPVDQVTEDIDTERAPVKLKDSQVDTMFNWNLEDDDAVIEAAEGSLAVEKARETEADVKNMEQEEECEIDFSCLGANEEDVINFCWYMEKKFLALAKREKDSLKLLKERGKMGEYDQKSKFFIKRCKDIEFAFFMLRPSDRPTLLGPEAFKSMLDNFCQYCLAKLELFCLPEKILYCSFLEEILKYRKQTSLEARLIQSTYDEKKILANSGYNSKEDSTSIALDFFPAALEEINKRDQEEIDKIIDATNQIKKQMRLLGSTVQIKENTSPRRPLMRLQSFAQIEEDMGERCPRSLLRRKDTY